MKSTTKTLIVLIVLVLSIGPISFFISPPQQIEPPTNGGDNGDTLTNQVSATITAEIMELTPYIYYAGVSESNDESSVRAVIDSVPEIQNYSLSLTLNDQGSGYKYIITVFVDNSSDHVYLSTILQGNLSPFFIADNLPAMDAVITLPPTIDGIHNQQNVVVETNSQNITARITSFHNTGEQITLNCGMLITDTNYKLMAFTQMCQEIAS